jgi:hypothetical protein
MLAAFYLDLQDHVHTSKTSIDMVSKHYEIWKEYHIQKNQDEVKKHEEYVLNKVIPKREFEERYKLFLEENQQLKKKFEKSSVSKKQAALEKWIEFQSSKIMEFINVANE